MPGYRTDNAIDTKITGGGTASIPRPRRTVRLRQRPAPKSGARVPDHAILGEELGLTGSGRFHRVLDPVDGTRPILCRLPVWGTLIGMTADGRAELRMMSQPFARERFWADRNGAWIDHDGVRRVLATRDFGSLDRATQHTTSPEYLGKDLAHGFARLEAAVRMTHRCAECQAIAIMAAGRIDLAIEPRFSRRASWHWIPTIERAGGVVVTRLDGMRARKASRC
ncbi:inositol monophosphatase family protein [Sphingomonas glacialis]|nr:inositol monophosphatase family protein [Sphingomonas glacialis]